MFSVYLHLTTRSLTKLCFEIFVGIDSISADMKDKKLTVTGDIDPVQIVAILRKSWHTELVAVGPAKEEKRDGKKEEKRDGKKEDKDDDQKKKEEALLEAYKSYNPYMPHYYSTHSVEENPNACAIC